MFAEGLRSLPGSLRAEDRVAIYTMGCTLRGSAEFRRGTREGIEHVLATGLKLPNPGQQARAEGPCERPVGLWDSLAYLMMKLREQPGRRVILVASNGPDQGSRNAVREVWRYAAASAVTLFGVREGAGDSERSLDRLCDLTGGLALHGSAKQFGARVPQVIAMVRGRYIVEFPRARDATAGLHSLDVAVRGSKAVIRTSGIGVPVEDPKVLADPTTVPNDATRAPSQGTRRPLESTW